MTRAGLRAGLLGLGSIGRHHARVLRALHDVDLVAVADPHGDVHNVAGGLPVHTDVHELLSVGIDMCVVAVPTSQHLPSGIALAEAGVPTLIEKPLADASTSAEQLAEAFESAGVIGCVGHIERFNPAVRELRLRLDRGELGAVHQIVTRRQGPFPERIADVGVVMDLATHDIDLTSWVAQGRYESVSAEVTHRSGRRHEDLIAVVGRLQDGVVVNHLVNWLSPFKERVCVVTGELGAFVADTLTGDLTFYSNGTMQSNWADVEQFRGVTQGDVTRYAIAKEEPLAAELAGFRDAIFGRGTDVVPLRDGLRTIQVAEALLTSAATGRTQRL